jgi:hypothetical protein
MRAVGNQVWPEELHDYMPRDHTMFHFWHMSGPKSAWALETFPLHSQTITSDEAQMAPRTRDEDPFPGILNSHIMNQFHR